MSRVNTNLGGTSIRLRPGIAKPLPKALLSFDVEEFDLPGEYGQGNLPSEETQIDVGTRASPPSWNSSTGPASGLPSSPPPSSPRPGPR